MYSNTADWSSSCVGQLRRLRRSFFRVAKNVSATSLGAENDVIGPVDGCPLNEIRKFGCRRSPPTMPGDYTGRNTSQQQQRHPADPPTVVEIVAVMLQAGAQMQARRNARCRWRKCSRASVSTLPAPSSAKPWRREKSPLGNRARDLPGRKARLRNCSDAPRRPLQSRGAQRGNRRQMVSSVPRTLAGPKGRL